MSRLSCKCWIPLVVDGLVCACVHFQCVCSVSVTFITSHSICVSHYHPTLYPPLLVVKCIQRRRKCSIADILPSTGITHPPATLHGLGIHTLQPSPPYCLFRFIFHYRYFCCFLLHCFLVGSLANGVVWITIINQHLFFFLLFLLN